MSRDKISIARASCIQNSVKFGVHCTVMMMIFLLGFMMLIMQWILLVLHIYLERLSQAVCTQICSCALTVESKNAPLDAWGSERSPQPCICCAVNGKYCRVGSCGGETGDCETSGFGKSSRKERKKKEPEKSMDMGKVITERLYMSQRLKKSNPKRLPCLLILCSFPFPPLSETCPD